MDPEVLQAMQRWPDVPHAYGWLALDARGRWRLYPEGGGPDGGPPQLIPNEQIRRFIDRNYAGDEQGRWYFQNGPQRVYVLLDAAPFILRRDEAGTGLETHTGRPIASVSEWLLDDEGHLYARSDVGPGRIDDRDLPAMLQQLCDPAGTALLDALDGTPPARLSHPTLGCASLAQLAAADVPARLGYCPVPQTDPAARPAG